MADVLRVVKAADLQRCGVSKPYAHQLVSGDRTPSLKLARTLEEALGIPTSAWPLSKGQAHGSAPIDDSVTVAPDAASGAGAKTAIVQ